MELEHLKRMISEPSPSGREDRLQKYLYSYYKNDFDGFDVGAHGSLTGYANPGADFKILLAGHADEISLVVNGYNENGSLQVEKNGGVRLCLYVGCKVRIITENGIVNGIMGVNKTILEAKDKLENENLFVDIGCSTKEEAQKLVPKGSYIIHDTDVTELANDKLAGRAFDDRIGAYIVFEAARKAIKDGVKTGIFACATTGEETTGRGAYEAAAKYKPDVCVVVDVTYATDYTDPGEPGDVELGKGGVICRGSIPNRKLNKLIEECAEALSLPVQYETTPMRTYTDADNMYKTEHIPAQVLFSIPLRYMHSPVEVLSTKDVDSMIDILAEFLLVLNKDYSLAPFSLE